jgi:hypothetical protein
VHWRDLATAEVLAAARTRSRGERARRGAGPEAESVAVAASCIVCAPARHHPPVGWGRVAARRRAVCPRAGEPPHVVCVTGINGRYSRLFLLSAPPGPLCRPSSPRHHSATAAGLRGVRNRAGLCPPHVP